MTSMPPPHQMPPAPAARPGPSGPPSPARAVGTPLLTIVAIALLAWLVKTSVKVLSPVATAVFLLWLLVTLASGDPSTCSGSRPAPG